MRKLAIYLSLFLALVGSSFAANKFIGPTAAGSASGADWNNRWKLGAINWAAVNPGDNLYLMGGTYTDGISFGKSGTSGNPISWLRVRSTDTAATAAAGWLSSMDAQVVLPGSIVGIWAPSFSYNTVDGRIPSGIFWSSSSSGAYFSQAATAGNISNIIIRYVEATGINNTGSNPTYGINWANATYSATNCLIEYSQIHHMTEPFRAFNWVNMVVQYCEIHHTNNYGDHADYFYLYGTNGTIIRYNNFHDSPADGFFSEYGQQINFYFYGNVVWNSDGSHVMNLNNASATGNPDGPIYIYNNVFHAISGNNAISVTSSTLNSLSRCRNNIFFSTGNDFRGNSDYNAYNYTVYNGYGWPSGELHSFTFTGNPFTSILTGDAHIVSGSQPTFANKGQALTADGFINKDPDGNIRGASGAGWDIGQDQFSTSGTPPANSYFVDVVNGNDSNLGTSAGTGNAWKTLAKASSVAGGGDVITVAPGLYPGGVSLFCSGTPGNPVIWKAANRPTLANCRNPSVSTIVSGSDNNAPSLTVGFRASAVTFTDTGAGTTGTPQAAASHVWSAPCSWLPTDISATQVGGSQPVDLYPYKSLAELQAFKVSSAAVSASYATGATTISGVNYPVMVPGPHGGFYATGTTLYVRLDPAYFTSTDPGNANNVVIVGSAGGYGLSFSAAVSTVVGGVTKLYNYNLIDGFSFEGIGAAALTFKGEGGVVQNCISTGDVKFIDGWGGASGNIQILNNEISCFPMFDDAVQAYADYAAATPGTFGDPRWKINPWLGSMYWQRKLVNNINYERAFVNNMGTGAVIAYNYFHDGMDAVSSYGISTSVNCNIHHNRFSKMLDNAVETEDRASGLLFTNNLIEDNFEPLSYQPQGGEPFPGNLTFSHNVFVDTPTYTTFWNAVRGQTVNSVFTDYQQERSLFKWFIVGSINYSGTVPDNYVVPGGIMFNNNTLYMTANGGVFNWNMPTPTDGQPFKFGPMVLANNLFIAPYHLSRGIRDLPRSTATGINWTGLTFMNNVCAGPMATSSGPGQLVAGKSGWLLPDFTKVNFTNITTSPYNFVPTTGSFLIGKGAASIPASITGVPIPIGLSTTVGAYNVGDVPPANSAYGPQGGHL